MTNVDVKMNAVAMALLLAELAQYVPAADRGRIAIALDEAGRLHNFRVREALDGSFTIEAGAVATRFKLVPRFTYPLSWGDSRRFEHEQVAKWWHWFECEGMEFKLGGYPSIAAVRAERDRLLACYQPPERNGVHVTFEIEPETTR